MRNNLFSIIARNGGVAPTNYNQFQKIVESLGAPAMADPMFSADHLSNSRTPTSEDHSEKYGVPSLLELGKRRFKMICVFKGYVRKKNIIYFKALTSRTLCLLFGLVVKPRP